MRINRTPSHVGNRGPEHVGGAVAHLVGKRIVPRGSVQRIFPQSIVVRSIIFSDEIGHLAATPSSWVWIDRRGRIFVRLKTGFEGELYNLFATDDLNNSALDFVWCLVNLAGFIK